MQGRGYDLTAEPGKSLWANLQQVLAVQPVSVPLVEEPQDRFGEPVLEAAHIKPYSAGGLHRVENGLLLRSDLHALFDRGYVTVTPELRVEVSRRIREEFENGRDYYALQGREILAPGSQELRPAPELLAWHNEQVFNG